MFRDLGASIQVLSIGMAPARCPNGAGTTELSCVVSAPGLGPVAEDVRIRLSDGDDSATVDGSVPAVVEGGAGNDLLSAAAGLGDLDGGDGADRLTGSPFADTLAGGAGSDWLDGGGGRDAVFYVQHHGALHIDLRRSSPQDALGERDVLLNVEDIFAGFEGPSRLIGNARANALVGTLGRDVLVGGGGNDRLIAASGDDRLYGGPGSDDLEAGEGSDYISARDGRRDVINCGSGRDTARIDAIDRTLACERLLRG